MKKMMTVLGLLFSFSMFSQSITEIENMIASERFDSAYTSLLSLKNNEPNNPYVFFGLGRLF